MKNKLLLLITLLFTGMIWAEKKVCNTRCKVSQKCSLLTPISAAPSTIEINEAGAYRLSNDVEGTIVIKANDVCLDLEGFTLTGREGHPAIKVSGSPNEFAKNITIKNGKIVHPDVNEVGIKVHKADGITLSNLEFHPVTKAIAIDHSKNGCLKDINVHNNASTEGKIINIKNSEIFTLTNIEFTKNTLTRPADVTTGLFVISGSDHINMHCCNVSKNLCNDIYSFTVFLFDNGDHLKVSESAFDFNGSFAASSDVVQAVYLTSSNHLCFKECTFNSTFAQQSGHVYGCSAESVKHCSFEECAANDTRIRVASSKNSDPQCSSFSGARGFYFNICKKLSFKRGQANNTLHEKNICIDENTFNGPAGIEIMNSSECLFEQSSFNSSTIELVDTTGCNKVTHAAYGYLSSSGNITGSNEDITVRDCSACGTTSKRDAFGFYAQNETSCLYEGCTASNQNASTRVAGFICAQFGVNKNIYRECSANHNQGLPGYGFAFEITNDVRVEYCQAHDNRQSGFYWGPVYNDPSANVNTKVLSNCADKNEEQGFFIKAEHPNSADNFLIARNKALDNVLCGFKVTSDSGNFANTFIGNIAEGNGQNYCLDFAIPVRETKKGNYCCKDTSACKKDYSNISFCSGKHSHKGE